MIKLINLLELGINNPYKPQIGKIYDIKVWWGGDEWLDNNFLQKIYEPTDGTQGGEEGWYWSRGWEYGHKLPDNEEIGFMDIFSQDRFSPYDCIANGLRKSTLK